MKKYILIALLTSLALNASEVHDIKIKKIREERPSVSLKKLETTKEPFAIIQRKENKKVIVVPDEAVAESTFTIDGIMNKTAYINGKWYKIGDIIDGYTIGYIGNKGVVLRRENDIKKVFVHKQIKNKIDFNIK